VISRFIFVVLKNKATSKDEKKLKII
jgi:hypothetical protein